MKRPAWVQRETVLILHDHLIATLGGTGGIRDEGLLGQRTAGGPPTRPMHRKIGHAWDHHENERRRVR